MEGDGTLRRMVIEVGQVNEAFATNADPAPPAAP